MSIFGAGWPCMQVGIVNLRAGTAFRGVIWDRRAGFLVLRNAERLAPRGQSTPIDGEVLIPERDVEFIQLSQGAG